ncbi:hypothetical protein BGZ65_001638 [Modicella reniformis]|uniref:Uncharacterized protein n=1 Tax=Modicella reniformis TaxID=1440133 RepID=A0A9P6LSC9_9FUNG|nr:hypothetical protein BGZ65_001638 [Modicella reniformis]
MQLKALILLSAMVIAAASAQSDEKTILQSAGDEPIPPSSHPAPVVRKKSTDGSIISITTLGEGDFKYNVYVNCSDGFRYAVASFQGLSRISIKCPNGSTPQDGGAYSI